MISTNGYFERVCINVGLAVESFQWFENAFTTFQEFQRMVISSEYRSKTGGIIPESAFKTPTSKQVEKLLKEELIDSEFAGRITALIDNRNKLIHRWVREEGWPNPEDESSCLKLIDCAQRIVIESKVISSTLAKMLLKIVEEFDSSQDGEKYLEKVSRFFLDARVQQLNWQSSNG